MISPKINNNEPLPRIHPRTVSWFGISSVAMGGSNQSLFLIGALIAGQGAIPGQGSAAVVLLMIGLLMSWAATPGWTELVMMYPNRVGGISATCAEAFKPYSPILANLTGVCYWWGWVPTCGITSLLAASALHQWYLPGIPIPVIGICLILFFTFINLCGVKWAMRFAMPMAVISGGFAFLSAIIPIYSGHVNWHQAFSYNLTVPFPGWFGKWTSIMAGIYLVGFAAPAYEQATSHVGEAINPNKSVPRAIFASAGMAGLYFIVLPVIWLGTLGAQPLTGDLSVELGPTFAPLFGAAAKAIAMWFITFNMFHGILAPLAGPPRVLLQLADDGLLPEFMSRRLPTDAPWVTTLLTAGMAIAFLFIGDPVWLIAAANLTYLIGIAMPNVAVWLMRRNHPEMDRPYRAPYGTIILGLVAAIGWLITTIFGFEQFGIKTVLAGVTFAYAGSMLYAWRQMMDRRKKGLPMIGRSLHLKLTGSMLLVLALDAAGYFIAVSNVPTQNTCLIAVLEDIFVVVALLTISVGLILPGMIAHTAVEISKATDQLVKGTLADFSRAMHALAEGNLSDAKANVTIIPVKVNSKDEISEMAVNFNKLQEEIGYATTGLKGAREGLLKAQDDLATTNQLLRDTEIKYIEQQMEKMRNEHTVILNSVAEGIHWLGHDGLIKYENPAAAKMLGYEVSELVGKPAHLTMHHSNPDGSVYPQCDCNIFATLNDGIVRHVENEVFWRKDGSSFPVEYTCTPVIDPDGTSRGCVVLFTDITERKESEEKLKKSNEELGLREQLLRNTFTDLKNSHEQLKQLQTQLVQSEKMASIGQLAAGVAHEINNPVGFISNNMEMLEQYTGDYKKVMTLIESLKQAIESNDMAKAKNIVNELSAYEKEIDMDYIIKDISSLIVHNKKGIERIRKIVMDLRTFAREDSSANDLLKVEEVIDSILSIVYSEIKHKAELIKDYSDTPAIKCNTQRLGQVFINLLVNAAQAIDEKGVIYIKSYIQDEYVCVDIKDNGHGIEESNMNKIFDAFFTTKPIGQGTGLGLSISYEIIKKHGGEIKVNSKVGEGTTFTIMLPIDNVAENI